MWTLVTGGAKRLGAAICTALAQEKRSICVHYRTSKGEADAVVQECHRLGVKAKAIQGDFSTEKGLLDFIARYQQECPTTSALINNVGNYLVASSLNTSFEEWRSLFQENLHAPFFLCKALAPQLMANKGHIINIGTSGLKNSAHTYSAAYALTKQALLGLTLSLARELAPTGVSVNMVSPGELDISVDHTALPMGRPATCSEVTRVIAFLLDPANHYITGQNIEVAGGLGLK